MSTRARSHAVPRDPDAASARRVGWRLAGLTIGLLTGLLIVLGVAVYFTMREELSWGLKQAISSRASSEVYHVVDLARRDSAGDARNHNKAPDAIGIISEPTIEEQSGGGVFSIFVDDQLTVVGTAASPFGATFADRAAAASALKGRTARYTVVYVGRNQRYLVYSLPVIEHGKVIGLVQTGVSEQQYDASLRALLKVLIIVSSLGLLASAGISSVLAQRALLPIRAALRRQRDFVADAAHELRTPLTILRASAELGLASEASGEQQAALEETLVQSNYLARLVEDLSLLARSDSGAVGLEHAPVDLARLVDDTVTSVAILAEDRGVRLDRNIRGPVNVIGDAARLRQLLMIIFDNALKFTPDGGAISIQVDRQGGRARLFVRDTGPGIAVHDLPHLFDRFYRGDRVRAGGGTGLGLSIGRWIAEAHGGHISAANAQQRGAVFTVTLPLAV